MDSGSSGKIPSLDDSYIEAVVLQKECDGVAFTQGVFGTMAAPNGQQVPVHSFTWTSKSKTTVQVINYGATITTIKCPDKNGVVKDVALGYDSINGYLEASNPYFGATVGRVCNRIGYGQFTLNGERYQVTQNIGVDTLHGGLKGFDKVLWNFVVDGTRVIMTYLSKDGEEGYPGDVIATVTFKLTKNDDFVCTMRATCTKPTIVNLTNHSYFNLAGHDAGPKALLEHEVTINADSITAVNERSIPTGEKQPVFHTLYDLQVAKKLIDVMPTENDGYDINYCVNRPESHGDSPGDDHDVIFVARAFHKPSGRLLEVYSDQPGVQFYTSNGMPTLQQSNTDANVRINGKSGVKYVKHSAFCFETQNYPDAINHDNFPSPILNPGETYSHKVIYKIRVEKN